MMLGTEYAAACWYLTAKLHGVTFLKAFILTVAAARPSDFNFRQLHQIFKAVHRESATHG